MAESRFGDHQGDHARVSTNARAVRSDGTCGAHAALSQPVDTKNRLALRIMQVPNHSVLCTMVTTAQPELRICAGAGK